MNSLALRAVLDSLGTGTGFGVLGYNVNALSALIVVVAIFSLFTAAYYGP